MTNVELRGLTKTYPGSTHAAVQDVTLPLPDGTLTALLGPSGSGKSTTLSLAAGLLSPDEGDVVVDGASLRRLPAERRPFATVFQRPLLFPHLSVRDNVAFGLRMRRVRRPERARRVAEALELVQLPELAARPVHQLSGGQEQRVALARALVTQPRLLLLDEPFSSLDPALREEMRALLATVRRRLGTTTLLVTHDLAEAVELADSVALLLDGRVAQHGAPRSFYEQPADVEVARFFGARNLLPGRVRAGRFCCAFGEVAVPAGAVDGPATLVVRPERVQLVEGGGPQVLPATVRAAEFRGDHTLVRTDVGGTEIVVRAPADVRVVVGCSVGLHLPVAGLVVVPGRSRG